MFYLTNNITIDVISKKYIKKHQMLFDTQMRCAFT